MVREGKEHGGASARGRSAAGTFERVKWERLRTTWTRVRRRTLDSNRDELGEPWMIAPRSGPGAAAIARASDDTGLAQALNRMAESFETLAASLESDRQERRARLDDVDGLLRELVLGLRSPAALPPTPLPTTPMPPAPIPPTGRAPVVVAGTIDLSGMENVVDARESPRPSR